MSDYIELELLDFIKENENWEELLTSEPYSLAIRRDGGYILFKYNQISSDFSIPLVRESRGIIFRERDWKLVCLPFSRFFNIQEPTAAEIDWATAVVQEKLDGSLIKVWWDGDVWHVSTNGTIDACDADVSSVNPIGDNFYDLFLHAAIGQELNISLFNKNNTYLFELTSPYTKIVVHHSETSITHLATRSNLTGEYLEHDIGIRTPRSYELSSPDECLLASEELPFNDEGYVVMDANFNMVKIKSPAYVEAHRLVSNGVITPKRILGLIEIGEMDEFLAYFPEYEDGFQEIIDRLEIRVYDNTSAVIYYLETHTFDSRKELAEYARTTFNPSFVFSYCDGKIDDVVEWFHSLTENKKMRMLGYG